MKFLFKNWLEMAMQQSTENFIAISDKGDEFKVYFANSDGKPKKNISYGWILARRVSEEGVSFFRVKAVTVQPLNKGWGPLLYDIAMEVASKRSGGLASEDLNSQDALFYPTVSPDAMKIWDFYCYKREDVLKTPIPEPQKIIAWRQKRNKERSNLTPLDYYYSKSPTLIDKLNSENKLLNFDKII